MRLADIPAGKDDKWKVWRFSHYRPTHPRISNIT